MKKVRTLILGGGMSGLSCAYHLNQAGDPNYLLIERSDEPGGLSRSIKQDGFVFDHTGHLLHLHDPYTQKLIPELLGDNIVPNERRAWVYSHNTYSRYPYQANLYRLPPKVILECLGGLIWTQILARLGLIKARRFFETMNWFKNGSKTAQGTPPEKVRSVNSDQRQAPQTLEDWVLHTFGAGFGKHFFFPYNKKLWAILPDELTTEWLGSFVPKPSVLEVIKGSFSDQTKKFGYNATFYYPKEGGIQALAFAFARKLPNIRLNTSVNTIDLANKTATLSSGETVAYEVLVNTTPLVRFLDMTTGLPDEIRAEGKRLRWSSVYDINLGVRRADISEKHWIYFPEPKYRFYRVGFPMNFSKKMTPPGCSSMYVEIGYRPDQPFDEDQACKEAIIGLKECGLLRDEKEIVTRNIIKIPIAYVTYDKNWKKSTDTLRQFFRDRNIFSIGRFGDWKYSYMEAAILEGKATAEKILGS